MGEAGGERGGGGERGRDPADAHDARFSWPQNQQLADLQNRKLGCFVAGGLNWKESSVCPEWVLMSPKFSSRVVSIFCPGLGTWGACGKSSVKGTDGIVQYSHSSMARP